ncbi:MAG: hypothetical protein IT457_11820 [Planctomycetes bacterium]|nr:hypothetical protein [Planctomycetota bacterium]
MRRDPSFGSAVAGIAAWFAVACAPLAAQDLDAAVKNAIEHPRFAMRRAAATRLAQAGDGAIPPLRAYLAERARNVLPLELVDALARGGGSEPTAVLLREWAGDREFFWRAQALGGLARRAHAEDRTRFREALADPSHLMRIEGARGLLAVAESDADRERVAALLGDEDPRCRLRVALALFAHGDARGVGEFVAAVEGQDRVFLDDPFGAREAQELVRALRELGHDARAAVGEPGDARDAARAALRAWAREKHGDVVFDDTAARDAADFVGGLEIRSCRNGDLFLRWTATGRIVVGLAPLHEVPIDAKDFAVLQDTLRACAGVAVHGNVVCDFVRVRATTADGVAIHHKAAPGSVPESLADWLKRTAADLERVGSATSSRLLADRLPQFLLRSGDK